MQNKEKDKCNEEEEDKECRGGQEEEDDDHNLSLLQYLLKVS